MVGSNDFNSDSCAGCIVEKCMRCIKEPCSISERVCELCTEGRKDTDEFKEIVNRLKDCQRENLNKDLEGKRKEPDLKDNDPYLGDECSDFGYDIY